MKRTIIFISLLVSFILSNAQQTSFTQTIKGIVTDEQSGNILSNSTVSIDNAALQLNTISDDKGNFKLQHVPIGRQQVRVSAVGYEEITMVLPNLFYVFFS